MNTDYSTPLWNTALPAEERIGWLLDQMTTEEKMTWMSGWNPNLERLGIPGFSVGGEAAHGVQARNDQGEGGTPDITTSFVQPIGMSATWDPALLEQAGNVTGTEARILADRNGNRGLSRWAPTVDLERDPRWGRTEEGYGEDPFLTAKMAGAYVRGIQGPDPDHLLAASTLKHFYGNNTERGRGWKSASIDPRNKWESYLKTFIGVIREGHPEGIMTAYNRINGIPGIMNPEVRTVLKDMCGLQHAVGDGGAAGVALNEARQKGTGAEIIAAAVKAGVDSMSDFPGMVIPALKEALEEGLLTEQDLDRAIGNVMRTKIRLGLYDGNRDKTPHPAPELLLSEKHRAICRKVSEEAMVLLKNDGGTLPLDREKTGSIALIGPWADDWRMDWYGGFPPERETLRQAIENKYGKKCTVFDGFDRITLHIGGKPVTVAGDGLLTVAGEGEADCFVLEDWGNNNCLLRHEKSGMYVAPRAAEDGRPEEYLFADRKDAFDWFVRERVHFIRNADGTFLLQTRFEKPVIPDAAGALTLSGTKHGAEFTVTLVLDGRQEAERIAAMNDTVILALGCHPMLNAKEEEDRTTLDLPEQQMKLAAIPEKGKGIAILFSNYPYAIGFADEHLGALLWSATGAQDLGSAAAATLFGDNAPAGRLNMTWYRDDSQLTDMDEYDLIRGRKTYRYFPDRPLYPFGHGLTYTEFRYDSLKLSRPDGQTVRAEFTVTNTGAVVSDEVAQLYWSAGDPAARCPIRQLAAFERIRGIVPGETVTVCLNVPVSEMMIYDPVRGRMGIRTGEYLIRIGSSSGDIRLEGTVNLEGEAPADRDLSEKIFADSYDGYEDLRLIPGQYRKDALTPANGTGTAVYGRCRRDTLTDLLSLRMYCENRGRAEVRINGVPVGRWEGNTLDYHAEPRWIRDSLMQSEEAPRIAMQKPVWCDVLIPLKTEAVPDSEEPVDIQIVLGGDAVLNWFRCIRKPVRRP